MEIENEFTVPTPHRPRVGVPPRRRAGRTLHAGRRADRDRRRHDLEGQGQHEARPRVALVRRHGHDAGARRRTRIASCSRAKGMEQKGKGAANASVTSWLEPGEGETHVKMKADIHLTGTVAQLSRGLLPEVSRKLTAAVRRLPRSESMGAAEAGRDRAADVADEARRRTGAGQGQADRRDPARALGHLGRHRELLPQAVRRSARSDLGDRPGRRRGHAVRRDEAARDPPGQAARAARGRRRAGGGVDEIVVVLGHDAERVRASLRPRPTERGSSSTSATRTVSRRRSPPGSARSTPRARPRSSCSPTNRASRRSTSASLVTAYETDAAEHPARSGSATARVRPSSRARSGPRRWRSSGDIGARALIERRTRAARAGSTSTRTRPSTSIAATTSNGPEERGGRCTK